MQTPVVLITSRSNIQTILEELEEVLVENNILIRIVEDEDFPKFLPKLDTRKKQDVPVDLTDEQFLALAKIAHEKDITINELAEDIIRQEVAKHEK